MRGWFYILMTALFMLVAASPGMAESAPTPGAIHLPMRLVAESEAPAAGGHTTLAIVATPEKGWHGYWKNGGDAGLPTEAHWALPKGVSAGELRYPVPGRLKIAGLMNYVYERPFTLLVDLSIPAGLAKGTPLPVTVKLDYLVCTDTICVPESQTLSTKLTVGDGAVAPATRAEFDRWRAALPRPLGGDGVIETQGKQVRIAVPLPASVAVRDVYFYPERSGIIDHAAPQVMTRSGDQLILAMPAAAVPTPGPVSGVLSIGEGQGLSFAAKPGAIAGASGSADHGFGAIALAFLGAVLGGLLLNIMPCVFPILSLKALSLAKGGGDERHARTEALAYTAGVVLVCVGLGVVLLALRAGGQSAGWAFQLQDPRVIGILLLLVAGIAFNLAGLFELPTPAFAGRSGAMGSFATGALAAFVATPCSGPFMAGALGAALVLPAAAALAVFAGLGIGIALPFIAIGFVPALRRRLPKPGMWMVRLRHILSVPMFLTALALAWILGQEAGVTGMTLGLAAGLIASLGFWWTGLRQHSGKGRAGWPAIVALVLAIGIVVTVKPAAAVAKATADTAFTEAKLDDLRKQNRPVFAYFTADWCLSCKVNEAAAIERSSVRDAFQRNKVAVLVGDWTDGDPVLGRFIERHNRAGVPLYLYYAPGAKEPQVLPQVLTPSMLEKLGA
ncbi:MULTISPECIES: protein-disulfide reductase DsbD family protein [Sphingomonas]|jgi:DsbC/DsbD-like thiol-disulfide interchange protein/cytochrome c biogenesis protein CcdA|uniref:Thiol:disulfide interchange protein n=2 Tax=Sphingomonas zeae TaxID=1646122 RepID=A0A7Y6B6Q1_9SPHN|nr:MULTISPECIES: protein-disulfide reductase DsbD domain-containing protein [Sphingomonas]MBB4047305.1 DsbC/DsbD-like thiol-disulfide interchange protein/cytochrome c biogenesis protein CcdA [Sphingomonas zeae]MDK8214722.1 protein-disulfide reductase DsbD family protein [Sphingomonas sp. UMB7805-LC452B]NUU48449.1 thiol:disulfide interchange protein [Sphingomonas zeae]